MSTRAGVPVAEVLLLGVWMGAALLFSAVVAPAAFDVLPSRTLAGAMVGRILPVLCYSGVVVGSVTVLLDLAGRNRAWGRAAAGAVAALACAVAQLVVGTRIDRLRAQIGAPIDALPTDDPRRIAFGRLHATSVIWLGVAILAAAIALGLAMRAIQRRARESVVDE
jgi:hypothetical protein